MDQDEDEGWRRGVSDDDKEIKRSDGEQGSKGSLGYYWGGLETI